MAFYLNPDGTLPWQGALESDGGGPVRISFRDYVECCCGSSSGSSSSSSGSSSSLSGSSSSTQGDPWSPPCCGDKICNFGSYVHKFGNAPSEITVTMSGMGTWYECAPLNGTFVLRPTGTECIYGLKFVVGEHTYSILLIIDMACEWWNPEQNYVHYRLYVQIDDNPPGYPEKTYYGATVRCAGHTMTVTGYETKVILGSGFCGGTSGVIMVEA